MGLQLRLDKKHRFGDIARDIIGGFETVLTHNKQPVPWGHRQRTHLVRLLRNRLAKAIHAYAACGHQSRCQSSRQLLAAVERTVRPAEESQKILLVRPDIPLLCVILEAAAFDRFYPGVRDDVWLTLKPELDRVIEAILQPVLYENAHCDGCSLCTYESRLSPWSLTSQKPLRRRAWAV